MKATHKRITAYWHLDYTLRVDGKVVINRIWRDDEKSFVPNSDCWRTLEEQNRTVIGLVIGKSTNGIAPQTNCHEFKVSNPKHIFSYNE